MSGITAFFNEFQATRLDNVLDKVVNVMLLRGKGIKDHADAGVVLLAPFNSLPL